MACVRLLSISAKDVYHTLMHLEHGVSKIYSFEAIARDSLNSIHKLADGCNLDVHEVKVDLFAELDKLKTDAQRDFHVSTFEGLLDLPEDASVPAFEFHRRVQDIFRRLNDAHTTYVPSFQDDLPTYKYVRASSSLPRELVNSTLEALRLRVFREGSAQDPTVQFENEGCWRTVKTIDDWSAWAWMLEQADRTIGKYKSRGARLNAYLNAFGGQGFYNLPWPPHGKINVVFADSLEPREVEYTVVMKVAHWTLQFFSQNSRWKLLQDWLDANLQLEGKERQQALVQVTTAGQGTCTTPPDDSEPRRPAGPLSHAPPRLDRRASALQTKQQQQLHAPPPLPAGRCGGGGGGGEAAELPAATEIARYPNSSDDGSTPLLVAYKLRSGGAVVLKVTSFRWPFVGDKAITDFLEFYQKLVDAAYGSTDRLILDLVGNGGGTIEIANLLTYLMDPEVTRGELCNGYAALLNPHWKAWLASFGGKWEEVEQNVRKESAEDIEDMLTRIESATNLYDVTKISAPIEEDMLEELIANIRATEDLTKKHELLLQALEDRQELFTGSLWGDISLVGRDSDDGWYPFTGDVTDPRTGKAFSPIMEPYQHPEVHHWGDVDRSYSQRFHLACSLPFENGIGQVAWPKHRWSEIAVLTNGLCGSACSLLATKLQLAFGATVFSYGGVPGEAMDASAFAGGNVLNWEEWWPHTLYAAIVGDIVFGSQTPIGQELRKPGASKRHYADTLLLPLPTNAKARFNFNMMFINELGKEALPREWYIMPAHRHYEDKWLTVYNDDESSWEPLKALYERIAGEDWPLWRKKGANNGAQPKAYGCAKTPAETRSVAGEWQVVRKKRGGRQGAVNVQVQ